MAQQLRMLPASSGGAAQVFPLRQGLIDITTGTVTDPVICDKLAKKEI